MHEEITIKVLYKNYTVTNTGVLISKLPYDLDTMCVGCRSVESDQTQQSKEEERREREEEEVVMMEEEEEEEMEEEREEEEEDEEGEEGEMEKEQRK